MKTVGSILLTLILMLSLTPDGRAGQLDAQLQDDISRAVANEMIRVWIVLNDDHDGRAFKSSVAASGVTRAERYGLALTGLKRVARTQENVLNQLRDLENRNLAQKTKGHWIVNVVEAEVVASEIASIAARSDVDMVYTQPHIELIAAPDAGPQRVVPSSATGATSNLQHIQADVAWANGYTGQGALVCSFDTGVRGDHPALLSRWKGHDGDSAAAWFDPIYGESFPHSVNQGGVAAWHGTHTLGIIVGDDPDPAHDTAVGVAPGAKWIAAAVVDIDGASILDAFEWAADPDGNPNTLDDVPDVISHSWGFELMSCANVFYDAIDNTEALGIVNILAGGNHLQQTTPTNPADRALDSLDCFAVGSINHTVDQVDVNSPEGPSPCNALGIKPNVMAPGRNILSASYNFETIRYRTGSGTSQAAPHVAGLVALLRGKNPNATVDEVKEAILTTTRWSGTWGSGPNNIYGWGEIDCWAALQALSATNSQPNVRVYDFDLPDINPGDIVTGKLVLQNLGASIGATTITLLPTNPDIEILDGSLSFGAIAEGDTVRSFDDLSVAVAATVEMGSLLAIDMEVVSGGYRDTLLLQLVVGQEPGRATVDLVGSRIEFTLSDFGAFGFAPTNKSIYKLDGLGFTFDGSQDLFEGGVMVGDGFTRVSSGIHSILWDPDFDFRAVYGGEIRYDAPGSWADLQTWARFDDHRAKNPIGLEITQESYMYDAPDDDFVVLKYAVQNRSDETLTDLYFGLFLDFWIINEMANAGGYESEGDYTWMAYNASGVLSRFRAVRLLKGDLGTAGAFDEQVYHHWPAGSGAGMDGFSTDEKYLALTSGSTFGDINKTAHSELGMIVAAGPLTMIPDQTDTLVFAILAGNSHEELRDASLRAAISRIPCCVDRVGDVNGEGGDEPTIGDVSLLVDALFITTNVGILPCIAEADINQSGGTEPSGDDLTIGDVSILIDYLFITGQSMGLSNCGGTGSWATADSLNEDSLIAEVILNDSAASAQMNLYLYNDVQDVANMSSGFSWTNPKAVLDSVVWAPEAVSAFDRSRLSYYRNNLDSANSYRRIQATGIRKSAGSMAASTERKPVCSYYFSLNDWSDAESLGLEADSFIAMRFVDPDNGEYAPVWHISGDIDPILPTVFTLYQNYPNPFNPETVISFDLIRRSNYRLEIINMLGQTVKEYEAIGGPGQVDEEWNGAGYASGAYFYRVTTGGRSITRKMILLK